MPRSTFLEDGLFYVLWLHLVEITICIRRTRRMLRVCFVLIHYINYIRLHNTCSPNKEKIRQFIRSNGKTKQYLALSLAHTVTIPTSNWARHYYLQKRKARFLAYPTYTFTGAYLLVSNICWNRSTFLTRIKSLTSFRYSSASTP